MQKEYNTVLNHAVAEIEEKKSRFIANVKPVTTEEEALDFLSQLKTRFWDATHNVFGYFIAGDNIIQRYSDDGEPSGTAGLPIIEVIRRKGVQDLVVVVTRYYGGTNLGAAGLIRAYSKSASLGIEAACIVKRVTCAQIQIIVEYPLFGRVQNQLEIGEYTIKDIRYGQDVEMTVFVPTGKVDSFVNMIEESTNGRAIVDVGDDIYITVSEKGEFISA